MAAQITPHTPAQIEGLQRRKKSKCSFCGKYNFGVIESTKTKEGAIRRRYSCGDCLRRETRFEVDSATYDAMRKAYAAYQKIEGLVLGVTAKELKITQEIPCNSCVHYGNHGCSFEYPEADTSEAVGCSQYQKK